MEPPGFTPGSAGPEEIKTVAVLEIPPVDSPQTAVKVAIAAKAKSAKKAWHG